MKYSETGNFNYEQTLAINRCIRALFDLQKVGCYVVTNTLGDMVVYKREDILNSTGDLYGEDTDIDHPLRGIPIGTLDRQFGEIPCFKKGYITEE